MLSKIIYIVTLLLFLWDPSTIQAQLNKDNSSILADRVIQELQGKIPEYHLPVYRDFTLQTISALSNIKTIQEIERGIIVRSIVTFALDQNRHASINADGLRQRLEAFIERHKASLEAVTSDMLRKDWRETRKNLQTDIEAVGQLLHAFFTNHPVVILDINVNLAVATFIDSLSQEDPSKEKMKGSNQQIATDHTSKLFFGLYDRLISERMTSASDFVDSIFLIHQLKYQRPLSENEKQAIKKYLENMFLYDRIVVLSSISEIYQLIVNVTDRIFDHELPATPDIETREKVVAEAFDRLSRFVSIGQVHPVTFGGKVPQEIRYGARFGFKLKPKPDPATLATQIMEMENMEQIVNFWFSTISRILDVKDALSEKLLWEFFEKWKMKIFSSEEFFGNKTMPQLSLSTIENRLLELIRRDRKENAIFIHKDQPLRDRIKEYEQFLWGQEVVPLDSSYMQVIQELQKWLDTTYGMSVTQEDILAEAYRVRTVSLFDFLAKDIEARDSTISVVELSRLIYGAIRKFEQIGAFRVEKAIPQDSINKLSTVEQAFYTYLRATKQQNPVLKDFDEKFSEQVLWDKYRAYIVLGRAENEQTAYDSVVNEIKEQLNKSR